VVYGHEVKSKDDKFLSMAEKCVWLLSNRIASSGGIWPVDIFPFLKHIPTWVPGMAFKRNAIKWKAQMEEFVNTPYELVQANIVSISPTCQAHRADIFISRKQALRFRRSVKPYSTLTTS
jgi:hypothetical protein